MIHYTSEIENITPEMLLGFFEGWPNPPSPETHLRILRKSYKAVVALDDTTGQVVGFINAISDDVLAAYIPLLEVLPEYRCRGIGKELIRQMLESLSGFYMIDLICLESVQPFYEKLGMFRGHGMIIRNFEKQPGR